MKAMQTMKAERNAEQLLIEHYRLDWEEKGGNRGTLRQARKEQSTLFPAWRNSYRVVVEMKRAENPKPKRTKKQCPDRDTALGYEPGSIDFAATQVEKSPDGWWLTIKGLAVLGPFENRDAARRAKREGEGE
jgi:hypothetical protein